MKSIELRVPDLGVEGEVEVIELLVEVGERVSVDDPVLVLESDKAAMEIPSEQAGYVLSFEVKLGDKVSQGDALLTLDVATGDADGQPEEGEEKGEETAKASEPVDSPKPEKPLSEIPSEKPSSHVQTNTGAVHAGPATRKFARELGVDLALVSGSGSKGRIVKDDVQAFVKSAMQSGASAPASIEAPPLPDFSKWGEVSLASMSRIQLKTAQNLQVVAQTVPQVTQFDHADITELEAFRKSKKTEAERHGTKLTLLPLVMKACAKALETMPQFNVSLDMAKRQVVQKYYINIGFAVDTPEGLLVPVVKNVNQKGLWDLSKEIIDLSGKARDKQLKPQDMQGGCFSISSLGSIGGTAFTPIVNAPEVAILGLSKADIQPRFDGENFEPRLMLPLSLSYDHRAINGADAARFARLIAKYLEDMRELLF